MQLLIAIAALCSVPTFRHLTEDKVLQCQKYYIKCYKELDRKKPGNLEYTLMECVEKKKQLGGSE